MELGELAHRVVGLFDRATGELVALVGRRHVFEHEHEVVRRLVPLGVEALGDAHVDRRRDLLVEAHLALVVPQHLGRGEARLVGGRHLQHDRVRQRGIVADEAHPHVDADVAVADALGLDRVDVAAERLTEPSSGDLFPLHGAAR